MTSKDEIFTHLSELLQPHVPPGAQIRRESLLVEDLGLDSVITMEVLMDMEDRLDASIPLNFLPEVHTVDDLIVALQDVVQ